MYICKIGLIYSTLGEMEKEGKCQFIVFVQITIGKLINFELGVRN